MKSAKKYISTIVVGAGLLVAPIVHAENNLEFIQLLNAGESVAGGTISASYGDVLSFSIDARDGDNNSTSLPEDTSVDTTTASPVSSRDVSVTAPSHNWSYPQKSFSVPIPDSFSQITAENAGKCGVFLVRISAPYKSAHNVYTTVRKERLVRVCPPTTLITDPSPTPESATPSPEPEQQTEDENGNTVATTKPSAKPATPSPTPRQLLSIPVRTKPISMESEGDYGSTADAVCARTPVIRTVRVATMAAPAVGILPFIASTLSFIGAMSSVSTRRKPEHWVKVVDSATGKGVGGAIINVIGSNGKVKATWKTEDSGNTGDILPKGRYEFVVQKEGWAFPSSEEPTFPLQQGEFVYRSGAVNLSSSKYKIDG